MLYRVLRNEEGIIIGLNRVFKNNIKSEWEVLSDKHAQVKEFVNRITYVQQRAKAYPSIGDQLDMMYHDKINGTSTWAATIATIKAKYPKPSESEV